MEEDSQMSGEVEVVAYGTQKKVSVTGSLANVSGTELTKTPTGSVSNMLSGQMAGLTTGQRHAPPPQPHFAARCQEDILAKIATPRIGQAPQRLFKASSE